jgi:hypothetical protein
VKENEKYWLNLYNEGKIKIDFETGDVWSFLTDPDGHLLDAKHNSGYLMGTAGPSRKERYSILLHRLIWIVANGDIPDKIEINHKNGIKWDNRLINLELTTKSGNALHSRRILGNKGGLVRGEESGNAKLKEWQVLEIRERYVKRKVGLKFLAEEYNISMSTISDIIKRRHWKEI